MSIKARNELIELMEEYDLLKAEYDKINSIILTDSDLQGLRKKAGDRAIKLTVGALKDDIKKDIDEVEKDIRNIICSHVNEAKGFVGFHVRELAEKLTRQYVGPINNLSAEADANLRKEIESTVEMIMKCLKGV